MGWGTSFTTDVYINRVDVGDTGRALLMIEDCQEVIGGCIETLIGLAASTPQRCSDESMTDMVNSICGDVREYVDIIIEQAVKQYQLQLYVDANEDSASCVKSNDIPLPDEPLADLV